MLQEKVKNHPVKEPLDLIINPVYRMHLGVTESKMSEPPPNNFIKNY